MAKYVQIGVMASRDPVTGAFLPSVPIYVEATEEQAKAEEAVMLDVAKIFAQRMKRYIDAGGQIRKTEERRQKPNGKSEL